MALPEHRDRALVWLRITYMLANKQSVTRTKLDQEMGNLALLFTRKRIIKQMLTFEIIYYLMQLPRLSNSLLTLVISRVTSQLDLFGISLSKADPLPPLAERCRYGDGTESEEAYLVEYFSGLVVISASYCLLGDSDLSKCFLKKGLVHLPRLKAAGDEFTHLTVHLLYWAGRTYLADGKLKKAERFLARAKKFQGYMFQITHKINAVLKDIRQNGPLSRGVT